MKISINYEVKSSLVGVLKLDGSPAEEGEDWAPWSGEYHKAGKWSYAEGGVLLREGVVVISKCSTHYKWNNQRFALIVKDNEVGKFFIMGRFTETPEKPQCPPKFPLGEDVWGKVLDTVCAWGNAEAVKKMKKKWLVAEKFA